MTSNADLQASATHPTSQSASQSSRFNFQHSWFELIRPDWEKLTAPLRGRQLRILEIGSFEGASTTWILENLMSHPDSTMTAVDTFAGGMEHQADDTGAYGLASLESRFRFNVSQCEHASKLRVIKATSDDALIQLRTEGARFDFIYIDASHVSLDVLHDAVLSWRMLDVRGTLVFDDFTWKGYNEDCYNPRVAIISFLQCAAPELEATETESQLWATKVPNHISATKNPDSDLYYWEKPETFSLPITLAKTTD
ncbi:hypothetical protein MMC26_000717 [Xylographa opegraphella]|nr:hypothetical protein [Xylographa opegraphella]